MAIDQKSLKAFFHAPFQLLLYHFPLTLFVACAYTKNLVLMNELIKVELPP